MSSLAPRRVVLLLYNVGSDAFSPQEIVDRQLSYVKKFREISPGSFIRPLVLASGFAEFNPNSNDLIEIRVISKRDINPFEFLIRSLFVLRRLVPRSRHFLFVAGNPLQPLAISLILKIFFPNSRLQVSLHGDLRAWFDKGLKNLAKRSLFLMSLPKIDLLRFVSEPQLQTAESLFKINNKGKVVCPIPVNLTKGSRLVDNSVNRLGFVGRAHKERGVFEWVEIAKKLPEFDYLVVGDGPEFKEFRTSLPSAQFMGKLSHSQTLSMYAHMSVFLNCAPYESYGLSIREALLAGVPVVTRKTAGVQDLLHKFPGIIKSYSTVDEAVFYVRELALTQELSQFEHFYNYIKDKQDLSLQRLVSNWP